MKTYDGLSISSKSANWSSDMFIGKSRINKMSFLESKLLTLTEKQNQFEEFVTEKIEACERLNPIADKIEKLVECIKIENDELVLPKFDEFQKKGESELESLRK